MNYDNYAHVYGFLNQANNVSELNSLVGDALRISATNATWPNEAIQYFRNKVEKKFDPTNSMNGPTSTINSKGLYRSTNNSKIHSRSNVISYQSLDNFLEDHNRRGGCRSCGH